MTNKKKKEPLVVAPPITSVKLKKIGERHGDQIGDEFKPKRQLVVKKKPSKSSETKGKDIWDEDHKEKQRTLEVRKRNLRESATKYERFFESKLKRLNIDHLFQKGFIDGLNFMISDFYIPKLKLVVELDGEYHYTEKQQQRDYFKDKHYKERKCKILRIPNKQAYDFDFDELKISVDQGFPTEYLKRMIY